MWGMLRRAEGQASIEYAGVLAILATVFVAVGTLGLGDRVATAVSGAVCQIAGSCGASGTPSTEGVDQAVVDQAARDLRDLREGHPSPQQVADHFAGLDPRVAAALAELHPELVGDLDGAPIPARYTANAALIDREIARLRAEGVPDGDGRLSKLLEFDDPDRHFLLFDPSGDGRVAEVFGPLETADHVAIVVPGMGNDLNNFDGGNASRLQTEAGDLGARSHGGAADAPGGGGAGRGAGGALREGRARAVRGRGRSDGHQDARAPSEDDRRRSRCRARRGPPPLARSGRRDHRDAGRPRRLRARRRLHAEPPQSGWEHRRPQRRNPL